MIKFCKNLWALLRALATEEPGGHWGGCHAPRPPEGFYFMMMTKSYGDEKNKE